MESSGALVTIFGIVAVSALSWAFLQYAPRLQQLVDNNIGEEEEDPLLKSLQPLYKVFYKFAHNSSSEWIKWILTQEKEVQEEAFDKLKAYLEVPPEELGIATKEVIKAVTHFKFPNSFDILTALIINIRPRLGQLKSIDLFYADLCNSIIELDTMRGIPILEYEINTINDKDKTELALESFKITIVKTLTSIKDVNDQLKEIFASIVINRDYSGNVRKEIIRGVKGKDDSIAQYIYLQTLQLHLDSSSQVLNKDHQMVLEELFYNFKHLIQGEDNEIWHSLFQSCYNESTQELFMNLLTDLISNPEEKFNESQLLDVLNSQEPMRDRFRAALIERYEVTPEEQSIFRTKLKPDDITFHPGTIIIEKSKKTKVICADLLPVYYKLETALEQDSNQTSKAERKAKYSLTTLTGTGVQEKIYLLRGLAANTNRSFVYIDLPQMLVCITELNKLISTISNSKPSIVFIDNLLEVLEKELDMEEEIGLKHFLKSVRELTILPTVAFYTNLAIPESQLSQNKELSAMINSHIKGAYTIFTNIDKPNQETRENMINDLFSKITPSKIDEAFSLDKLIIDSESMSLLEFISFITNFLEKSLMVHGKIA